MKKRLPREGEYVLKPDSSFEDYCAAREKGLTVVEGDENGFVPDPTTPATETP